MNFDPKYKFTETWFDASIPGWVDLFNNVKLDIKRGLEVGCYEGRATIWLCENVLKSGTKFDVIDTFKGSSEEDGMKHVNKRFAENPNFMKENFLHNISFHRQIDFTVYDGYSDKILPTLKEEYDFIYIDASHRADDTFVDGYYCHKLLKPGGIIIFDDFGWKDPKNLHPNNSPQIGVEFFNTMYDDEYQVVLSGYQVGFLKKIK